MSNNLTMHRQWSTRPEDERFADLQALRNSLREQTDHCGELTIGTEQLQPVALDGEVVLQSKQKQNPAQLTHWSFGQLAGIAKAPADYLRSLPAPVAVQCLEYGLSRAPRDSQKLYVRANGQLEVRAITSPGYSRILTLQIVDRLIALKAEHPGWKAPLVYPAGDFGGQPSPCVGFAGDRDAYICLTDDEHRLTDPTDKTGQGLARGIMVVNSEVGAKRLDVILFACQYICGNFIIWGFKQIAGLSMRHFGEKIREQWSSGIGNVFHDYANTSPREENELIARAARKELGPAKDDVVSLLFDRRLASKRDSADAYDLAEKFGGNPRSVWGVVGGLTRLSQLQPYMDRRVELDRAAANVLNLANQTS